MDGCKCKLCEPTVPMGSAHPFIMARLQALAKSRGGDSVVTHLDRGRYLFESRKRDAVGNSRPISRQQGWYRVRQAMQRAGIDSTHHAIHSLRKTSARKMLEASGGSIIAVRDWLHHRSSATTDAYLRSDNFERLRLAEKMGAFLEGLAA